MADKVQFELVSPERLLVSQAVDMVVVPGSEGDFGVLPGHAPFISTVRPGVIEIFEGNTVTERIFVAGGFAEVSNDRCTVLAEQASPLTDVNRPEIEAELRSLNEELVAARDDAERSAIATRIEVAEAKLAAAQ
ncbi:MAG TPA: F0F1 ATP synthase subunit epsilon [Alphaproteobacteria bacterium]|nr:F0F1 ATP synthase subunit epsilon [Alphaproteobacteria bacterium]